MRCFLISSLIVVSFAQPVIADRKISEAAKVELERGEQRFRDKDYAAAIAAFDAGYAIDPQPIFLYDKAQAQRLAGDCKTAIDTYKAFLATEPAANEAVRARKNIENCEAVLPRVEPQPRAIDSEPARAEPATRPTSEPAPIREQRAAWWGDGLGMTLLTTGVIGIGVGTGFVVMARSAAADTALATNTDEWSAANARWQRDRIVAGVALGAGAALTISGVLRLSLRDRTVHVAPPAAGNGAVVSFGGRW